MSRFTVIGSRRLGVASANSDTDLLGVDCPENRAWLRAHGFELKEKGHFCLARKGDVEVGLHPVDVAWWIENAYRVATQLLQDPKVRAQFLALRAAGRKAEAYNLVGIPTNDVLSAHAQARKNPFDHTAIDAPDVRAEALNRIHTWWAAMNPGPIPARGRIFLAEGHGRKFVGTLFLMPWSQGRRISYQLGLSLDSGVTWDEALQHLTSRLRAMRFGQDVSGIGDPAFLLWARRELEEATRPSWEMHDGHLYEVMYELRGSNTRLDRLFGRLGWVAAGTDMAWGDRSPVTVWQKSP